MLVNSLKSAPYGLTWFVALLTLVIALVQPALGEQVDRGCIAGSLFYIYGMTTCPYCERLHEFLDNSYSGLAAFCAINEVQSCDAAFNKQTELLLQRFNSTIPLSPYDLYRVFGAVPRTLVVKNKTYILAVVIGLVENADFWNNITCYEPSSKVPVFYGDRVVGHVDLELSEQPDLLKDWIVDHEPKQQAEFPVATGIALAIVIATGLVVLVLALRIARKS